MPTEWDTVAPWSSLLAIAATLIAAVWAWLGSPVSMPQGLSPGEKLYCISLRAFRGLQTPFDPETRIPAAQIEQDWHSSPN